MLYKSFQLTPADKTRQHLARRVRRNDTLNEIEYKVSGDDSVVVAEPILNIIICKLGAVETRVMRYTISDIY